MKVTVRRVVEHVHVFEHDFLIGVSAEEAQCALEVAQDAIMVGKHREAVDLLFKVTGSLAKSLHAQLSAYDGCPTVSGETRREEQTDE